MERDIDYVIAVAECRSISQAAETLYISQPSLSRFLSNLEKELGMALFVRTVTGVEMTEAGKIYVEYAKEIKRLRSTMKIKLRELQKSESCEFKIGMPLNTLSLSIFEITEKVKTKYPYCSVELFNIMSKDIPEALKSGRCDFAIGPDLDWPSELKCEIFELNPYVLVVPDRYDLSSYAEEREDLAFPLVDIRNISKLDFILQDKTTAVRKGVDRICKKYNVRLQPKMVVTSSAIALQAVENGMGCCVVGLGHLIFLNNKTRMKFYQISAEEYSSDGVISLNGKIFSKEELYCVSCIKKALIEANQNLMTQLNGV